MPEPVEAPDEVPGGDARAAQQVLRTRVWRELRAVARPDSRFHWDFSSFIADFEGSDRCIQRIRKLEAYRHAEVVFVTPDNCLELLREAAFADGKAVLATTYGIGRGFLLVRAEDVPMDQRPLAATLDGFERFARAVGPEDLAQLGPVTLLVTGASAVTTAGVRFGKGHGYFDLEWAMLGELGAVTPDVEVVAVVHDCQIVDAGAVPAHDHDALVDWIVTPSATHRVRTGARAPGAVRWGDVDADLLARIPVLGDLRRWIARREAVR